MNYSRSLIGALSWAIAISSASADDWPQWQGPDRNAVSKETGLLKEWPKDGPRSPRKSRESAAVTALPPLLPGGFSA